MRPPESCAVLQQRGGEGIGLAGLGDREEEPERQRRDHDEVSLWWG